MKFLPKDLNRMVHAQEAAKKKEAACVIYANDLLDCVKDKILSRLYEVDDTDHIMVKIKRCDAEIFDAIWTEETFCYVESVLGSNGYNVKFEGLLQNPEDDDTIIISWLYE